MKEGLEKLRQRQRSSLGYLLITAGQKMNEAGLARAAALSPSFAPREAHVRLLPFLLEHSGISATELASRVGVSKQAVQPLVEDFVHAGYVRRVADEKDGRAKRLYLTRAGLMTMNAGTAILEALETELLNGVRKRDVENVKSTLRYLLRRLEERDAE